jgi:hypothetical protein
MSDCDRAAAVLSSQLAHLAFDVERLASHCGDLELAGGDVEVLG